MIYILNKYLIKTTNSIIEEYSVCNIYYDLSKSVLNLYDHYTELSDESYVQYDDHLRIDYYNIINYCCSKVHTNTTCTSYKATFNHSIIVID